MVSVKLFIAAGAVIVISTAHAATCRPLRKLSINNSLAATGPLVSARRRRRRRADLLVIRSADQLGVRVRQDAQDSTIFRHGHRHAWNNGSGSM
jgi:hypothetical protein